MLEGLSESLGLSQGVLLAILVLIVLVLVGFVSFQSFAVVDVMRGVTVGGGARVHVGFPAKKEGFSGAFGTGGTLLQEMTAPGITAVMPSDRYF